MNSHHREVLRKNRVYLVKELLVDVLWPSLLEHGIFTDEMLEHIKATGARPSQVYRLLSDLTKRGPHAFAEFLECLEESDQSHIADKLREAADALSNGEPTFEGRGTVAHRLARCVTHTPVQAIDGPVVLRGPADRKHRGLDQQGFGHCDLDHRNGHSLTVAAAALPTPTVTEQRLSLSAAGDDQVSPTALREASPAAAFIPQRSAVPPFPSFVKTLRYSSPQTDTVTLAHEHIADGIAADQCARTATSACLENAHVVIPRSISANCSAGGASDGPAALAQDEHPDGPCDVDSNLALSEFPLGSSGRRADLPSVCGKTVGTTDVTASNWDKIYKMTSTPRGYCVIISNRYFTGHLRERIGTDVDRDNLYRLFSQLGYMISIKENLTAMDMLITLRDFAQLGNHRAVDSCAVVLLTHGLDGQVYGCDRKLIELSEVFSFFDGAHCPSLKGKPKIMFVQACRGEKYDAGFEATDSPGASEIQSRTTANSLGSPATADDRWMRKLPSCSDFLIAYATIPGHVSWRNSEEGSWFVKAFCEVFSRNAHHTDATSMLVEVNDKVATAYESATGHKQMPAPVVLLRKKLYFYPPLMSAMGPMPR